MRPRFVVAVLVKELRDLLGNKLLIAAVMAPALIFAAIPTGLVALLELLELHDEQLRQVEQFTRAFPDLPPRLAAQGFIVLNFMAYFLLIPAMVPMAIATQSVIGEKQTRSLEPQLATPLEVSELLIGKAVLTILVFNDVWQVAMISLVPLICLFSVLLGIIVSSRVNDPRTAQQIGGFIVIPIIGVAIAQFFGGSASFTLEQVIVGDLIVAGLIGLALMFGSWVFDREAILTRMG